MEWLFWDGFVEVVEGDEMNKYREKEWLKKKYLKEEMSMAKIAKICGCNKRTICLWIKKHGIKTRWSWKEERRLKFSRDLLGKNNPNWNGGKRILVSGHIMVTAKKHPNATKDGYVFLHRLVMEKHLGRHLTKEEVVHHIDGDKSNNNLENLSLYPNHAQHIKEEMLEIWKRKRTQSSTAP